MAPDLLRVAPDLLRYVATMTRPRTGQDRTNPLDPGLIQKDGPFELAIGYDPVDNSEMDTVSGQSTERADKLAMKRKLFNLLVFMGLAAALLPPAACLGGGHACCCGHSAAIPAPAGPSLAADCPCPGPALGCAPEAQPLARSPERVTLPTASSAPAIPIAQASPEFALATHDQPAASSHLGESPPLRTLLCTLRI